MDSSSRAARAPRGRAAPPERPSQPAEAPGEPGGKALRGLAFAALGVVFGDIATSPLYAFRACFNAAQGGVAPTPGNVYGVLSLVLWSLILVITVKYVSFVMRANNRGEGGILALLALATPVRRRRLPHRKVLVGLGLFGAALLYGDGMITPAISVLGAVEGLERATPAVHPFILPLAISILIGLFALQRRGTARMAPLFSPIALAWFVTIAALGSREILREPGVLAAANPLHAARFVGENGLRGFLTLGFVFLVVIGGEALYADMGHFGRRPIRAAWFSVVLPALVLNYFGQGALLVSNPAAAQNPFYALVPEVLLFPVVALASAAAVVASQAVISGAFSLTGQAMQLGYLPRVMLVHTSPKQPGQIYVPGVSRVLMIASIALVLGFGSADDLARAYGIAVSGTMTVTTLLFYVVLRTRLNWRPAYAALLVGLFLFVDASFLAANLVKVDEGGWFPLTIGAAIFLLMYSWVEGRAVLLRIAQRQSVPLDLVIQDLDRRSLPRIPGTAVFMTPDPRGTAPLALLHHLKHNKALHQNVVLLSIHTEDVPFVPEERRVETRQCGPGVYCVLARYGFLETPNAPEVLASIEELKHVFNRAATTYYLGRHTLLPTGRSPMPRWRKELFMFLYRNARPATRHYRLPANQVVEMGAQIPF